MGEQQHAFLQAFFSTVFSVNRQSWGTRVLPEQRVQTSESRYRIADICILRIGDPPDPIVRVPPLVCIEILSRRDSLSEMQERVNDYAAMGVENIWIVDPRRRHAWTATQEGFLKPADGVFSVPGTPIRIPLADIFAELDELAAGR